MARTIRPNVRRPSQGRLRHTAVRHEPFMSDKDYNYIVRVAQNDNPRDPDTPAAKLFPTVTIAVLVEIDAKKPLTGIGHTGIAISEEGVGFDPAHMRYYDFGPKEHKSEFSLTAVDGGPWWYKMTRGYDEANQKATGSMVANPKLSDILRDLPRLSLDVDEKTHVATLNDVHMVVTQVTADQGANIEAFWKNTIYAFEKRSTEHRANAEVRLH